MADDGRGAGQQQGHVAAVGRKHRPREAGGLGSVAARVAVGAELARVLQRRAGRGGRQPVDLQGPAPVEPADRRGRREHRGVEAAQPVGPAHAEAAVALRIVLAQGDRVQVVPHPQQVRMAVAGDEAEHAPVGGGRGRFQSTGVRLVQFDRAELQPAALGPAHVPIASVPDRTGGPPDLERSGTVGLQADAQVTRVVHRGRARAEAQHRQHVVAGEQGTRIGVGVVDRQAVPVARHCGAGSRAATCCLDHPAMIRGAAMPVAWRPCASAGFR